MGLDLTYGTAFIGLIIASILYGVTLLQTFLYYRQYPRDSLATKGLVFLVWFLDTAQLVLSTIAIYWYLVTNYNNPEALGKTTWSQNIQTDCNGLIGLIVECFFAQRVWRLSRNIWLTVTIVILSVVHFGLGVVFTVKGFILVETSRFTELVWVTTAGLGSAAAADIIIAIALCYYLLKSRTGFQRTDSLITALILYSITTGLITGVLAFVAVVAFATMPTNYVWLAFFWVLGKCYVNSFLAALSDLLIVLVMHSHIWDRLNSRESLREIAVGAGDATFLQLSPVPLASTDSTRQPKSLSVHIQTVSKTNYE